jgi:ethanolamine ammonia-lyase small subunit
MDSARLEAVIQAVVKELGAVAAPAVTPLPTPAPAAVAVPKSAKPTPAVLAHKQSVFPAQLTVDLADPTVPEARGRSGIASPADANGLAALLECTTARIGVGRSGPCLRTGSLHLFMSDHAVTRDALDRDVDPKLLSDLGMFSVKTRVEGGKEEYLIRPDLGRRLSDEAKNLLKERCDKEPDVQICVGDGLSAQAVETNLRKMLPVIQSGCTSAGLRMGTPFFIQYCRVGVMNDIGDLLKPKVLILLIGERPGLGRADSMSAYMAYRPQAGHTDAERDVICNIFDGGGVNPLEAGAYALRLAQKMLEKQTSGVKLKLMEA